MTANDLAIGLVMEAPTTWPSPSNHKSLSELRAACFHAVLDEYNPSGFAETMLAREVAQCAAQIICDEQLQGAAESEVEQALAPVLAPLDGIPVGAPLSVAQICAPERLESLSRAALRNSNAFVRRLRELMDLQRDRQGSHAGLRERDSRFANEMLCVNYLVRRFRFGRQVCRACGQACGGSWIATRRCWECSSCHTQTCIRQGTVMARSPLPLANWFHAIRLVLYHPTVSAAELAASIGIRRVSTVRSMLAKIQAAMLGDDASGLLAGLDAVFMPGS